MTSSQGETLAEDIDLLLGDLCVGWGYCNYTVRGKDLVRAGGGNVTGDAVARAVMEADGEDPAAAPEMFRAIRRFFHYRYGAASVSEADYAPGVTIPYTIDPPVDDQDNVPPDPILLLARETWCRAALGETGTAKGDEAGAQPSPMLHGVSLDDVMHSLRAARRRKSFSLGSEQYLAGQDLRALILLHEMVSGEFWNSDPEGRRHLGLGKQPGTLAESAGDAT